LPSKTKKEAIMATATKKVKIKLPLTRTEKDDKWCAVNGKPYQIQRGKEVEVPDYVAEVLRHEEEMLSIGMAYEAEASKNLD
jgi:hypothetical protein